MGKYERGEIAEIVLSTLLAVGVITVAVVAPNALQIFKYFKPKNAYERRRIKQSIDRLEQRRFVKGTQEGYYELTAKGKLKALRYRIETTKIQPQKEWGGKWWLIMFDVPEEKKAARRAINFALKKIGCVRYQKSVFITPFPCEKEIDFIGECFGVREHIRIIVAERIEGDDVFRRKFHL
ncbi:MAG: hypothetical protein AAB769_01385 [Patescibacteria group bacterium]